MDLIYFSFLHFVVIIVDPYTLLGKRRYFLMSGKMCTIKEEASRLLAVLFQGCHTQGQNHP
jgi:hypothetical protein